MSRKPTKSTSLVPVGRRKPPARRKATTPAVISATADALLPILGSSLAVAKLVGTGGEVAREGDVTLVTGRDYATREMVVPADEIYYDGDATPAGDGPWLGEADKVSWRDQASGYDCIMLRDTSRGFLSGYVGLPRDHPLWGWECEAVPSDLGIDVHGGLTYSAICQDGPSPQRRIVTEAQRICHSPHRLLGHIPFKHATDHRVANDDAWWLGFSCDHAYDLSPGDLRPGAGFMKAEVGASYRDDGYVARETTALAAQLLAIANDGTAPGRDGPPPPPIGLDPDKGGRA